MIRPTVPRAWRWLPTATTTCWSSTVCYRASIRGGLMAEATIAGGWFRYKLLEEAGRDAQKQP